MKRFSTLRGRLQALISTLVAGISLVINLYLPALYQRRAERAQLDRARSVAAVTAFGASPALVFRDTVTLGEVLRGARQSEDFAYVEVTDSAGRVIARSGREGGTGAAARDGLSEWSVVRLGTAHVSVPVEWNGSTIGRLALGLSLAGVRQDVRRARVTVAMFSVLVLLAGMAAAGGIARRVTRPLDAIVEAADSIARGDRSSRAPVRGTDEIARLAAGFNAMVDALDAARLESEASNRHLEARVAERTRELESAQSQLLHAQKMEAVGRLAGGVAHDFNNLLTVIVIDAELALRNLPPAHPSRDDLVEVLEAAASGRQLTQQLLAFGRKQLLRPSRLALGRLVEETQVMLRRLIGEDIVLHLAGDEHLRLVDADASQLQQVIMNLAVNARDAMPQGGTLAIETWNVEVDEPFAAAHSPMTPGSYVRLSVRDTGFGMSPEVLAHAFEPFFTTKEVGQGTGLGLATVYGIVKQSGGFVWVDSVPGVGTEFSVYFPPVSDAPPPAERTDEAPSVQSGAETILVVEDETHVRIAARRLLAGWGYTVLEAKNGWQALKLAENHPGQIHLLLSDVVMPGMNGFELARQLVALRPDVRILFTSGYPADAIESAGGVPMGAPLVAKPYTGDQLARAVRSALAGQEVPG